MSHPSREGPPRFELLRKTLRSESGSVKRKREDPLPCSCKPKSQGGSSCDADSQCLNRSDGSLTRYLTLCIVFQLMPSAWVCDHASHSRMLWLAGCPTWSAALQAAPVEMSARTRPYAGSKAQEQGTFMQQSIIVSMDDVGHTACLCCDAPSLIASRNSLKLSAGWLRWKARAGASWLMRTSCRRHLSWNI